MVWFSVVELSPVKLKVRGWIENENEKYSNIPNKCPKCGSELWKTDALQTCGIYWIGCKNFKCR